MADQKEMLALAKAGGDIVVEVRVTDMTERAADAARDVAKLTHGVPARQMTARHAITGAIVLIGFAAIYLKPEIGWPVAALVAVLGGTTIAEQLRKKVDKD